MAERDFGPQASAVLAAWRLMSEAAGHLPYIPPYFRGPEFLGPCHPLLWEPDEPVPEIFHAALYYLQENEATFATTAKNVRHALVMTDLPDDFVRGRVRLPAGSDLWTLVVSEYGAAAAAAGQAYEILREAATAAGAEPGTALGEELALVEFLARTWRTTWHTVRFLLARRGWAATGEEAHRAAMVAVARDELANARDARHLFSAKPWLNLGLRVDSEYPDSLAMLDAKIVHLAAALDRAGGTEAGRGDER